jgi:hypothetical protein
VITELPYQTNKAKLIERVAASTILALVVLLVFDIGGWVVGRTAGTLFAAAVPFWYAAAKKLRSTLADRMLPMTALLSAFCFVLQLFNLPLMGGTTGHATGASLAAV